MLRGLRIALPLCDTVAATVYAAPAPVLLGENLTSPLHACHAPGICKQPNGVSFASPSPQVLCHIHRRIGSGGRCQGTTLADSKRALCPDYHLGAATARFCLSGMRPPRHVAVTAPDAQVNQGHLYPLADALCFLEKVRCTGCYSSAEQLHHAHPLLLQMSLNACLPLVAAGSLHFSV